MGLPSYVINFDELVEDLATYLIDGIRVDVGDVVIDTTQLQNLLQAINDKIPNPLDLTGLVAVLGNLNVVIEDLTARLGLQGVQKYYGECLQIPIILGDYEVKFESIEDWMLTDITYSLSSWNYQDSWSLFVNNEKIFSTVYTKEFGENKHFEVFYKVPKSSEVRFVFHNNSGANKILWVDLGVLEGISGSTTVSAPISS